jgi:uncharacterized protein DUF3592
MNDTQSNLSISRLIGFLFGLPLLLVALFNLGRALKSQSWPWAPGIVASGEEFGGGEDQDYRFNVSYNVGSTQYVCRRVDWAAAHTSRDKYRYYVGANARVYYDPKNPASCVLEPGVSGWLVVEFIVGIGLSTLGLWAHGQIKSSQGSQPASSVPVQSAAQGSLDAVRELAFSNHTIEAIKMYRNLKGVDLKEAKDYVDELRRSQPGSR